MESLISPAILELSAGGIFVILAIRGLVELARAINHRVSNDGKQDACSAVSKVLLQDIRKHQETRCEQMRDSVARTQEAVGRLEGAINRLNENLQEQNQALTKIGDHLSRREE